MKKEKLSLKGIKNVLSRGEMRKIMAGSGGTNCNVGTVCNTWPPPQKPCCNGCLPYVQGDFCV